jgi:hypothetical protein
LRSEEQMLRLARVSSYLLTGVEILQLSMNSRQSEGASGLVLVFRDPTPDSYRAEQPHDHTYPDGIKVLTGSMSTRLFEEASGAGIKMQKFTTSRSLRRNVPVPIPGETTVLQEVHGSPIFQDVHTAPLVIAETAIHQPHAEQPVWTLQMNGAQTREETVFFTETGVYPEVRYAYPLGAERTEFLLRALLSQIE